MDHIRLQMQKTKIEIRCWKISFTCLISINNINYCTTSILAGHKECFLKNKTISPFFDTGKVTGHSEIINDDSMIADCVSDRSSILWVSRVATGCSLSGSFSGWAGHCSPLIGEMLLRITRAPMMSNGLSGVTLNLRRDWNQALSSHPYPGLWPSYKIAPAWAQDRRKGSANRAGRGTLCHHASPPVIIWGYRLPSHIISFIYERHCDSTAIYAAKETLENPTWKPWNI